MHVYGFGMASGKAARMALGILLAVSIAGCKFTNSRDDVTSPTTDGGGSTGTGGSTGSGTPTANRAPTYSGSPVTLAKVSVPYLYQPRVSDPDGDRLTFEVRSKPEWARFDSRSGRLEGIPPTGSTGTYTGVQIVVSDGSHTLELEPFSISVVEPVVGTAELVWQAPGTNEDGTPLVDLSGYVIRYGKDPGMLDQSVRIGNAGTTIYVVENLIEGTWYFSLSAVNGAGVESRPTGYISKTIG